MRTIAAGVLIVVAVAVFRLVGPLVGGGVAGVLANVSPLAAVIVAGAIYLPRRAAFAVPFGALFVSTGVVNLVQGWSLLSPSLFGMMAIWGLVFGMAWMVRGTPRVGVVLATTVAGTVLFYVASNSVAWAFEGGYARTLAGWVQAQTVGLPIPGAPPAWFFFVKSLVGDLLFVGLMIAACHPFSRRHPESLLAGPAARA